MATENRIETIKGFIHWQAKKSYQDARFQWWPWEHMDDYVVVCPHDITFEVPATFNPVASELAQIEATREELKKQFSEHIRRLDERVANLLCIGNATEATPEAQS